MLKPDQRLIGRAFTVQFLPSRPDLQDGLRADAEAAKVGALATRPRSTSSERRCTGRGPVREVEGGTFVGDKLAYYVQKVTGTGLVVDGGLFYLRRLEASGMMAYYRGAHPGSLTNAVLSGINVPYASATPS